MKTKDLIILTFPTGENAKDEVRISGVYLYAKHVRKHILSLRDPHAAKLDNDEAISHASTLGSDIAERAWLIEIADSAELESVEKLIEGKHYKITHQTHEFTPGKLDEDTGVYIVAHNEWGVTQVFGYFNMGLQKRLPDIQDATERNLTAARQGAIGVVHVMHLLGINRVKKLCMAACTMASPVYQESFLSTLIREMMTHGLSPMVAGWDIPITVKPDGTKVATGEGRDGPLREQRNKHKFIYKYETGSVEFSGPTKKVALQLDGKVTDALQDFAKKQLGVTDKGNKAQFEHALFKKTITSEDDKKKTNVKVTFDFATRISYGKSGWSSQH